MPLSDRLHAPKTPKRTSPLWKGPKEDGITFSLLSRFLCCRERFRLLVVQGLATNEGFNHRLEYGHMWHLCEEYAALGTSSTVWEEELLSYAQKLCTLYPLQQEQVEHWYSVCCTQFPVYLDYWQQHRDVLERKPVYQEVPFCVPYQLPSGRVVSLRGKWDSVDWIGKGKEKGIYVQENKTKGEVNESQLKRQVTYDLQTMIYLIALSQDATSTSLRPIRGVRYNVVRRPLSGGAGTIRQHKPTKSNPHGESAEEFYARLQGIIREKPETYFLRWKIEITEKDILNFRDRTLDPILEQLWDWWEWILDPFTRQNHHHWRHPYGCYNVLNEGGSSDLDEYLASGSEIGLRRTENLFPELT